MKLDSRGTRTLLDDRLLPGATFDLHLDNGDGTYEPDGADTRVDFQSFTVNAFLVFGRPADAPYWLAESRAPLGYEKAPAELLPAPSQHQGQNCIVFRQHLRCFADDDGISGFVLVVIPDDPAHLPPTDTDPGAPARRATATPIGGAPGPALPDVRPARRRGFRRSGALGGAR
jgi:hypothetical protein